MKLNRFAAALVAGLIFLMGTGCGTTGGNLGSSWPSLGWETNAPSLETVTNTIPDPVFKDYETLNREIGDEQLRTLIKTPLP